MCNGTSHPRLTKHQARVLAALRVLSERHGCQWWSRSDIGRIVQSGGFHDIIQVRTMRVLKELGLIQTEDSAWPDEIRAIVRCNCACYQWGLTDAGQEVASGLSIRWDGDTEKRIASALVPRPYYERRDEDDMPWYGGSGEDD